MKGYEATTLDSSDHSNKDGPWASFQNAHGEAITYITFYICGASNVVPWLSYILCIDHFEYRYPNGMVNFIFPIVNMSVLLFVTLFILLAGRALPINGRIFFGFFIELISLLVVPFITYFAETTSVSYHITLLSLVGCSLSSSIVQSSMYGLGGVFGPKYIQALEGGKGFAGVVLVIIRCITKWYFSDGTKVRSGLPLFYFFGVSAFIVFLSFLLYILVHFIKFAKPQLEQYNMIHAASAFRKTPLSQKNFENVLESSPLKNKTWRLEKIKLNGVYRAIGKPIAVLFITYSVCLSCFPGLTTSIQSVTFNLGDWLPIILVSAFNFGDLIGKSLPPVYMIFTMQNLHYAYIIMFAFIPIFFLQVIHSLGDVLTIATVHLLGLCTGYIGTSSLMLIPQACQEIEREVASIMGTLALMLGLFIGSYVGLGFDYIIVNLL